MPSRKLPAFVLVRPRNPGNIGAAARVMANFGFADLRIVAPYPPIWDDALKLAADSKSLVRRAKVYKTLPLALADRARVYGTSSLKGRTSGLTARSLPALRIIAGCALVFGPENNGLSEDDLQYCDELLHIQTTERHSSLNLAQAVAIVCYGISCAEPTVESERALIPWRGVERLIDEGERAFRKLRYRPAMTPAGRRTRLRKILRKRGLSREEAGMLSELLRRVIES
ncbi:MAG: TrmH family RNA methyltransferase [Elusimicrobiota bacterium]